MMFNSISELCFLIPIQGSKKNYLNKDIHTIKRMKNEDVPL